MSEESFFSFGQASRPDVGLIADSFQNLSEIYQSDKRSALRNIQIRPEILDSLYGIRSELDDREDFRFCSGLDKLLLPSLHQLREVYQYRIPTELYIDREFYNPDFPLGGVGSYSIKYPNVTLFNGSIQCEGAQYVSNVIGNTIFSSPERKQVFLSTSRASLFNSEGDPVNQGYYKSARYPGSIRVRRRSHVNRVFIPSTSFIPKPNVIESPTHTINVSVDNNNSGTVTPVKLLATKNTPLRVFCKLGRGSVKFTFIDSQAPYYFGFQVQPVQTRPNTERVDFLSVVSTPQSTGSTEFTVTIDITKTGYQNIYDLYLYLYVVPEKVKGIEFSGIDIKESPDKKDLGLIGFSNLEVFKVSGGSMTILPIWLKTLKTKLKTLDLASSSDLWRSGGPMGWFDIRDSSRIPSITHPLYTVASYLTIPKKGTLINENGDGWSDTLFSKYILNQSRVANVDYRQFAAMENLILGNRFSGYAPRLDDIFPNLRSLDWSNTNYSDPPNQYLFSALPKLNNNGGLIDYNIRRSGAAGNITDIGTSTNTLDSGHISRYKMRSFYAAGGWDIYNNISGYINNPSDPDWSAWRDSTIDIDMSYTGISINLQSGQWSSLTSLEASVSGGVKFDSISSPLQTPKLKYLSAYGPSTTGKMASLGSNSSTNTGSLETLNIGYCISLSPITENGINYLLPSDFAPVRPEGSEHKLINFYTHYLYSPFYLRKNDLINLHSLQLFYSYGSKLTGKFPIFPVKKAYEIETKLNYIYIDYSDFYDLQTLSISPSNYYFARDVIVIRALGMNANQGGAILPDLEGVSNSVVNLINIDSSLTTKYRYDWANPVLRDCCVLSGQQSTTLSGLAINRYHQNDIYKLTGSNNFTQTVLVNDSIRASESGAELARVLSVSNTSITISSDIPDPLPSTLYFTRNTVDISNWFKAGFSSLVQLGASNCRLSGSINIRSGFNAIQDYSGYPAVNLSNNVISSYVYGSLTKVFSGNSRVITVDLSNNVLPVSEIRKIIEEVSVLDEAKRFSNCLIKLYGNNLTSDKKYSNYSQQEIFPTTLSLGKDVITSLFRNESFQVYKEQSVVNSQLQQVYNYTFTGTQTLQFSGAEVSGSFYKTKRNKVQVVNEDYLAVKYGKLTGIRIDLGFTYTPPNTSPIILSTSYENETSRVASITESGLTPLTTCPSGVGSGLCWRNSLNQILKLV